MSRRELLRKARTRAETRRRQAADGSSQHRELPHKARTSNVETGWSPVARHDACDAHRVVARAAPGIGRTSVGESLESLIAVIGDVDLEFVAQRAAVCPAAHAGRHAGARFP